MEIVKATNIDFLKYKIPAMLLSLAIIVGGLLSIYLKGGLRYGVDFSGGTAIHMKFRQAAPLDAIRHSLTNGGFKDSGVQGFVEPTEVLIRLSQTASSGEKVGEISRAVVALMNTDVLKQAPPAGKEDLNGVGAGQVTQYLQIKNPEGSSPDAYASDVDKLFEMRKANKGLFPPFDQMKGIDARTITSLKQNYYVGDVAALSTEYVGPEVGSDLRKKATLAVMWSLVGILIYLWLRFEVTWSASIILCLVHDVLITLAMVSFFNREISLTVIAALMTIVGYSMNDTIVVYDRVRDNLKTMRTQPLEAIFNASINQTLGRTILTSGTVFLVVAVLYLFGGEVINDFAFCMLIGVISGTYSTVYIAAALVVQYKKTFAKQKVSPVKAKVSAKKA